MKKSKPLIFLGTEDFSAVSLIALIKDQWPISAVVTKPDTTKGRNRKVEKSAVKKIAEQNGLAILQPDKWDDIATKQLIEYLPAYGVLVAYGKIIPDSVLPLFADGIINVHPSLLPKYRGPSPIEATILSGDRQTGISLIRLSNQLDAGPIYIQESLKLTGRENRIELSKSLASKSADLLNSNIESIIDGKLKPTDQNDEDASITKLITKVDGLIDWTKPAQQIEREIRAYLGWPGSRTTLAGKEVIITSASIIPSYRAKPGTIQAHAHRIIIATSQDALVIETLKPAGKNEMTAEAFLAGHNNKI